MSSLYRIYSDVKYLSQPTPQKGYNVEIFINTFTSRNISHQVLLILFINLLLHLFLPFPNSCNHFNFHKLSLVLTISL